MGRRQLSLLKKRVNLSFLHLLFYLSPQWSGRGPPTLGRRMSLLIQMLILSKNMKVKSESEVAQSCLTLSNPMDCSLTCFSVHGVF